MAKKNKSEKKEPRKFDYSNIKPGVGTKSRHMAAFLIDQIHQYDESRATYYKKGDAIIKRFRDERSLADERSDRRMNMLWAHTKILRPAIYSKRPIPIIDRKFLDHDPVGRLSSQIAERSVRNEIKDGPFHEAMKKAVLDRLLVGQGVLWVRYDSVIGPSVSIPSMNNTTLEDAFIEASGDDEETKKEETLEDTNEQVLREAAPVDYVHYKDFYMLPCTARIWEEVQLVSKKVMIAREEAIERFGEEIGKELQATGESMSEGGLNFNRNALADKTDKNIIVYECWNKLDRKVYWVSEGYNYLCDVKDDPLELEKFFPCPKPLFATTTNNTLIPVPDFMEWQDQAIQVDELTRRIAMLVKACRVAGVYDGSNQALGRILDEGKENNLISVDNWAMYAEKGGLAGAISLLPLKEIQSVIDTLTKTRQQVMQDLDIVTGVNDIMRGTSDSRETLGGIRLKNNNTGTRLSETQEEVAEFARETIKLVTEIMCKHYSEETLVEQSGIMYEDEFDIDNIVERLKQAHEEMLASQPPPMQQPQPPQIPPSPGGNVVPFPGGPQQPQQMQQPLPPPQIPDEMYRHQAEMLVKEKIEKAVELLRNDIPRRYRIDIETDSTIFADAQQEKEKATEFLKAVSDFMQGAAGIVEAMPEALPLMGKMLQFGVRRFRAGRDLEYAVDEFVEKMGKKAQQIANSPKPDPDAAKIELEKTKQQGEIQKQQLVTQAQAQNDARDAQKQEREDQREAQKMQMDAQLDAKRAEMEQRKIERQFELDMIQMDREEQFKAAEHTRKMQQMSQQKELASVKATQQKKAIKKKASSNGSS